MDQVHLAHGLIQLPHRGPRRPNASLGEPNDPVGSRSPCGADYRRLNDSTDEESACEVVRCCAADPPYLPFRIFYEGEVQEQMAAFFAHEAMTKKLFET